MQKRVATTKTVFIEIILKPSLNNWNKTIIFLKNSPSLQPFLKRIRLTIRTYNYCEDSSFIPPEAELIKKVKAGLNVLTSSKVVGSKVVEGEITQNSSARDIRDGTIIFNGKIGSIFREKDQAKQVSAGLECGITLKDFADYQKKDIIEVYNAKITERTV